MTTMSHVCLRVLDLERSTAFYTSQQAALGDVNGYIEEMVAGQKVVKVFNHEPENQRTFEEKNETLRRQNRGLRPLLIVTLLAAVANIALLVCQIAGVF